MGWIGWLVVGIIVLAVIGHFIPDDPKKSKKSRSEKKLAKKPERNVGREAEEIAEKVTTIQQFRVLERKLETAENRYNEAESERAIETAFHKYEVMQQAVDIAASKTYRWQFFPNNYDLDTPTRILEHADKVFSYAEYQELKGQLPDEWNELDAYDEAEDLDPIIKPLIKFRSIVESNEFSREEKIKKINQLVSRNSELAEGFFDLDHELKPGEQWFAGELA